MRLVRSAATLAVFGPASIAVTAVLCVIDIAATFRDLAAADERGAW